MSDSDDGFTSVQWVMLISFTMVLLLMAANIIAWQYGRGAIRAAVDESARYGAALGRDAVDCQTHGVGMLRGSNGLLAGPMGDSVVLSCADVGGVMTATATGAFEWWVGGIAPIDFSIVGHAVVEAAP